MLLACEIYTHPPRNWYPGTNLNFDNPRKKFDTTTGTGLVPCRLTASSSIQKRYFEKSQFQIFKNPDNSACTVMRGKFFMFFLNFNEK